MAKPTKEQLAAMRKCGMSDAEIAEVLAADAAIDKGEKMPFDLTEEQAKEAKKYTKTETRKAPTVYKMDNTDGKRSRKENATKGGIIAALAKFLAETTDFSCENLEIVNKERQIAFTVGENKYEFTLVQKRTPKK